MARNRFQFGLTMLTGLFLLAVLFAILLYALTPETPVAQSARASGLYRHLIRSIPTQSLTPAPAH